MAPMRWWCLPCLLLAVSCNSDDQDDQDDASTVGVTGADATSTAGTDGTPGAGTTTSDETAGGSGAKLDVGDSGASASTSGGGSTSIYERCERNEDCAEGLDCITVGFGDMFVSQCTLACGDATDCPDAPPAEIGCIERPIEPGNQCALVCGAEGTCPTGYTCWNPASETSPCVPD